MKIIMAGGSGMIGQNLTRHLVGQGHEVWVLTRNPSGAELPAGVQPVRWDGRSAQGWGQLVDQADAIIHLAGANIGERPWTNARKQLIRSSRVEAGQAIVEAVRQSERRPALLLQIAGSGYYGVHGNEPLDESAPPGNDFLSKIAVDWENATQPVEEMGVRRGILRTGVVMTPKGGVLAPFILQNQLFSGGPLGTGKQWISWIHIQDLTRVFSFLLERADTQGIYNVASPDAVTNAEFGRAVARKMHRPYWLPIPAFMMRLVLGEMSTLVLDGQRVLPRRLLEMGFRFEFDTLEKALDNLLRRQE